MQKKFEPGVMGEVIKCDYLNVRTKVGPNEYVIVKGNQLKVGTRVKLLGYENRRFLIQYKGQDGYIYQDYVRY